MKPLMLVLAALSVGALAKFPDEPRFQAKVNLKVSESQVKAGLTLPLDVVLEALAKSVGLQPLIYRAYDPSGDPAKAQPPLPNVKLDFQGKPFREVWDLLFATYGAQFGLDYLFLPPDVVVVAPTQVITALVDAPSRTGTAERRPYVVGIPEIAYRRTETDAQGQARTVVNIDGAKAWVQNDLLPFLSREAAGVGVNWIVVEEGGKLKAILSVLATPEQHARFSDLLKRAGIDFRPLPALAEPKPRVERTYALTHATFPELLAFLQGQVPGAQVSVVPTDPKKAVVLATEEDHARLAQLLKAADLPKTVRQVYALQNLTFEEAKARLEPLLQKELKGARLEAIPGNPKALLLEATEADQALFAELLKAADLPKTVRQVYALQNLTFEEAKARLEPLLQKELKGARLEAIPGNPKALLLEATEADQALFAELLKAADLPKTVRQVYALQNLTFEEAKARLEPLLQKELKGARLEAIPGNPKALLLEATEADQALFAELLKAADLPKTVRQVYALQNLTFEEAKARLEPLLQKELKGARLEAIPGNPKALLLEATEADQALFAELLKAADLPKTVRQVYALQNLTFEEAKARLEPLLQKELKGARLEAIPGNPKALLLEATEADQALFAELLKAADLPKTVRQVYALQNLTFEEAKARLEPLLQKELKGARLEAIPGNPKALLLEATEADQALFAELLKAADLPKTVRQVYALQNLTFEEAKARLEPLLQKELKGARLEAIPGNPKALLLEATEADQALFAELLKAADLPKTVRQVYALQNLTFEEAKARLEPLLQKELKGARLEAIPGNPKALLLEATEADQALFAELLKAADLPKTVRQVYALQNLTFEEAKARLEPLLQKELKGARLEAIPGNPKALLLEATEADQALFAELLKAADLPKTVRQVYALQNLTFEEAKARLEPLLQKELKGARLEAIPGNPKALLLEATEADQALFAELLKAADLPKTVRQVYALQNLTFEEAKARLEPLLQKELKGARLEAIPGNPKALLLEATEADQALFAELLKAADVVPQVPPPQAEATVRKLYPLRFADAEKVAPFLAREVPGIVVQTVPGQPVLSVRGTAKQLSEVESLLAQIDRAPEQGPPIFQRTFQLSNAKAKDLAQVLQEALKAKAAPPAQGQGQSGNPTPTATVVADERTNTLIVTGTAEDLALVEGLIPRLDQAVPQVNLRVRIQEVQSNLTRSLGLKWNTIAGGNVVASILDSGLSLIFDSTRSLAALNIVATLDALQRQGLSRALRDVNQTVLNNQTARLQSGETFLIRRVVENRVERVPFDIGIIVEVTPQITADGQILLNIRAEVSGNVQRNPVDGDVDRFTKQVVTTTLRVRDGQTVVLGGLTSQENTQTVQGVPLLMDIPLIGELFKQRTGETTDRELLVVITADILKETATRP
jgi:type II secretory pathway component GspD/PulD (secretin)